MKEFKSYPKPEPKAKKEFGFAYWDKIKKKSFEKKKIAMKPTADKDILFYKYVWEHSDKHCSECGRELRLPEKGDARNFIHHILPKSTHPYFRHEPKNVLILCWTHHQHAESSISFPKMKVYPYCQAIKEELMNRFKP